MKLIETSFNNFRCFKQYEIRYGSESTIFIGKNGTGKSSILSGIRRGLSFMFAKPKSYTLNLATSNNTKVESFDKLEANYDNILRNYNYPIQNDFKALFNNQYLNWSLIKNNMNSGLLKSQYSNALHSVLDSLNNLTNVALPVLVVITDSFPHIQINSGTKAKRIIAQDSVPRDFGYYGWDERTSCIDLWLNRFYKVSNFEKDLTNDIERIEGQIILLKKLIENKDDFDKNKISVLEEKIESLIENKRHLQNDKRHFKFANEREFIQNKLMEFTKPLQKEYSFINNEFELYRLSVNRPDKKNYTLEFSFVDGRIITFETLPMGYKRLFSIVLDIAYRCYILNENIDSEGIVLIDEIELHLHPTLQQEVLLRLRKTFPKIQFIITTHSPLVISNFKANDKNKIIKLEHDGNNYSNKIVNNIFGIDYTTGLMEIMGSKYRPSSIDNLIDSIVILASRNRIEDAEKIKKELFAIVGDNNENILSEIEKRIEMNKK